MKQLFKGYSDAYLLPATIFLGLGITILSGTFLQVTAITSRTVNDQIYNNIANEAARAGITMADSCLKQLPVGSSWDISSPLKPDTSCTGTPASGSPNVAKQTEWQSYFSVAAPNADGIIVSTGTVEILNSSGTKVATYQKTALMNVSNTFSYLDPSVGDTITDLRNDEADCAIANGKLFCWGDNLYANIGDNSKTDRSWPTLVQGALAGKTITKVTVSNRSTCAIADGTPYCWGDNSQHQLGRDSPWTTDILLPTDQIPAITGSDLAGKKVLDVNTTSIVVPFIGWPWAANQPYTCFHVANGSLACNGDGGYRQMGGGGIRFEIHWAVPNLYFWWPSYDTPTLVAGFTDTDSPFYGKKVQKIGSSSHDSCLVAEGRVYCMGVEIPLELTCNSVLFSRAQDTVVPAYLQFCMGGGYSKGYDLSAKVKNYGIFRGGGSYTMNNRFVDPDTFDVTSNVGCMMADTDFVCAGSGPAVGFQWAGSFSAPWVELSDADVTSQDNGDNGDSASFDGGYCAIDKGVAKCQFSDASVLGGGGWSVSNDGLMPITTTNMDNAVAAKAKAPTKIAAGKKHACLVANGQLLCFGKGANGVLANGNTSAFSNSFSIATVTGRDRSGQPAGTNIGTVENTYAASGQISSGGGHSCAAVNGKIYCWGQNNFGQLGIANRNTTLQPQIVSTSFSYKSVSKISAGLHHTCAIIEGKLYCWGRNTNGQLGINSAATYETTPQLVGGALAGKRVSDVSAGSTGTCAIANGQAYCWGDNGSGQVGNSSNAGSYSSPALVDKADGSPSTTVNRLTGKSVTSITMGETHACAVANGDVFCWGSTANGRTGHGQTFTDANSTTAPKLLTLGAAVTPTGPTGARPLATSVSAGKDFTCAIINAEVSCWGNNANGRTGQNTTATTNTYIPTSLQGSAGKYFATSISAGDSHACALLHGNNSKTNGNMYCWGLNSDGQLGYNDTTDRSTVTTPIIGGDVIEGTEKRSAINISAGVGHTCTVANGVILCWGLDTEGQIGDGKIDGDNLTPTKTEKYRIPNAYSKGPVF